MWASSNLEIPMFWQRFGDCQLIRYLRTWIYAFSWKSLDKTTIITIVVHKNRLIFLAYLCKLKNLMFQLLLVFILVLSNHFLVNEKVANSSQHRCDKFAYYFFLKIDWLESIYATAIDKFRYQQTYIDVAIDLSGTRKVSLHSWTTTVRKFCIKLNFWT